MDKNRKVKISNNTNHAFSTHLNDLKRTKDAIREAKILHQKLLTDAYNNPVFMLFAAEIGVLKINLKKLAKM